jgi:low molecular weight protein-tyrosine phosphatase
MAPVRAPVFLGPDTGRKKAVSHPQTSSILMICLGNICRSPSAEAVFRQRLAIAELGWEIDSAGTGNWHVGQPPDARAIAAASARGLDLGDLRARQVRAGDFHRFTYIFAMDQQNLDDLIAIRPKGGVMPVLLLDYSPKASLREVPDPYYGGAEGFSTMLDLIEGAADGFVHAIIKP